MPDRVARDVVSVHSFVRRLGFGLTNECSIEVK